MEIKELFERLQQKIDSKPSKIEGFSATIQFSLKGDGGGEYYAVIHDGTGRINEGKSDTPDVTIFMDAEDFKDLVNKKLEPMGAFMSGKLKVQGDMSLMMKIKSLFH